MPEFIIDLKHANIYQGNAGFSGIKAVVHLESDADDAALDELHRKVVSTSPVGHSLTREVPVDVILG